MAEATQYQSFKARLVMGSLFDLRTTDHTGAPEPNESKHHWFVGFAVPKGAEWDAVWGAMWNAAVQDPACGQALCGQAGFNWKVEDCDAPENPQNLGKESYPAGHMLIKFTRYKAMGPCPVIDGQYAPLDKTQVKKGDWFFVAGSTKFNGAATVKTNAGMYQNINAVMFAEAGEEIVSEGSFNAATAFAGVQGGVAQRSGAPTGGAGFGGQAPAGGAAPTQPSQPAAPQQAPAAQPVRVYVHTDTQFTKEQYTGNGWTEEQLVNAGKGRYDEQPATPAQPAAPQQAPAAPQQAPAGPGAPTSGGVTPAPDFLNQPGVTGA